MGARAMRYFWASVTDLVGVTGFEPATSWSQTTRSTKLSYTPKLNVDSYHESGLFASRNLVTLEKLEMKTGSVFVLSVMLGYGAMLTLPAQVAAPPTVDLGSRKNQEAILTPTPTPPPDSPGSPNVPEISQLDKIFKDTSLGKLGDDLRLHVEWRHLENQVVNDPDVIAARNAAQRARTDLEKRQRLRDYYNIYYGRMGTIAATAEVKAAVEAQKVTHVNQTKQPRVRPATDAPPPTPTPPPGTTPVPTPKPKHAKKKSHRLFGQ